MLVTAKATTNTAKFKATICECITVLLTAKPTTQHCTVRSASQCPGRQTLDTASLEQIFSIHDNVLNGKGNDKHSQVHSNYLRTQCSALEGIYKTPRSLQQLFAMHYNALDGKGNDKHCKVRGNYLRTQCSALDGKYKTPQSLQQLFAKALQR